MDVEELLRAERNDVLDEAFTALKRSHHAHYEEAGDTFTRERLAELFDLVLTALHDRELAPVGAYCEEIAAFNTLEEAMWRRVAEGVPPLQLSEAIGLLSTIVGYGKDSLARRYVSLATERHVPTLDLSALFEGTER